MTMSRSRRRRPDDWLARRVPGAHDGTGPNEGWCLGSLQASNLHQAAIAGSLKSAAVTESVKHTATNAASARDETGEQRGKERYQCGLPTLS
jgi:hypothetical protein